MASAISAYELPKTPVTNLATASRALPAILRYDALMASRAAGCIEIVFRITKLEDLSLYLVINKQNSAYHHQDDQEFSKSAALHF